jgi:hypothetical protein
VSLDDSPFQHRTVDAPGSVVCPQCQRVVDLPKDEPLLIAGGQTCLPQLVSLPCPQCRTRIYLQDVSDEGHALDAEEDALLGDER